MSNDNYQKYLAEKSRKIKNIIIKYSSFLHNLRKQKIKIITDERQNKDQQEINRIRESLKND